MHLSDGEIKAYQDQELAFEASQRVEAHLVTCTTCQERSEIIQSSSTGIATKLTALDPIKKRELSTPKVAHIRLTARIQEKELNSMWRKLFSREARPAWIGLMIVLLLAVSMIFARAVKPPIAM